MQTVIRPLSVSDIPDAMTLVHQAGWNQNPADWMRFLTTTPDGCFKAIEADRLIGTVATIIYDDRLAWIGMMLVDERHRTRGIGRLLMETVLDYVDRSGIRCVMLDATPAGRGLYEKSGFVTAQRIERWELSRSAPLSSTAAPAAREISDLVMELDRTLFGADRRTLLRSIEREAPDLAIELVRDGHIRGYAFGRRGTLADHLGPWSASDRQAAEDLLDTFLNRSTRSLVYVDCFADHAWALSILRSRGFRVSRTLTRMCRGERPATPVSPNLLAIVGPEFG